MIRDDIIRMAKSTPIKKGIAKLEAELAQAWRDIETLPVVELAARNSSVADYVKHWEGRVTTAEALNAELVEVLRKAKAALEDIGDADREPGDDLAWCEARAAEPLPLIRAALAKAENSDE